MRNIYNLERPTRKVFSVSPNAGPVQLLDFDSNDEKLVTITSGSIEKLFLDPIVAERNVVVVSIAGALRKGKSFLLNYMLRYMYANVSSSTILLIIIQQSRLIYSTNQLTKPTKSSTRLKLRNGSATLMSP